MSVLLDALKKAAEEKKNLKEDSAVRVPKKETSNDLDNPIEGMALPSSDNETPLNVTEQEVSSDSYPSAFQFKLADQPDSDNFTPLESEDLELTLESNAETEKLSLNLEQEMPNQEPVSTADASFTEELPEFDVDSLEPNDLRDVNQDLAIEHELLDSNPTESLLNFSDEQSNTLDTSNSLDDLVNSLDTSGLSGNLDLNNNLELPQENLEQNFDSNKGVTEKLLNTSEEVSFNHGISLEKNNSSDFDSQSFDWSLDDLPGYSVDNSSQNKAASFKIEENPILIKGAHSSPKPKKSKYATSSRVIVTLFVFLFFVLIGFYGMHYFQEQNHKLERSMMKYNIASLNIPSKVSQQALTSTSITENASGVAVDTSNVAVVPKVNLADSAKPVVSETSIANTAAENQINSQTNPLQSDIKQKQSVSLPQPDNNNNAAVKTSNTVKLVSTETRSVSKTKQYRPVNTGKTNQLSTNKRIAKKPIVVTINKTKSLIAEAYEAYKAGKYVQANRLFTNALNSDAKNTKALMGLGAVAVINKNYQAAVQHYERVLSIKPNDLNAIEAIANLSGAVALNNDWDDQLISAVKDFPQSAILQNAVGNTYAKQRDWLKAQKAYFNALVNKPDSADYMVNLAVSYDHLGEYQLAAQYYTQALGHAQQSRTSFNTQQVKSRLVSIKQLIMNGG